MQIDSKVKEEAPSTILARQANTKRVPMFTKLDSKLCIATVLGYLLCWEEVEGFFRCLNKRGKAYLDQHKAQFRHFIDDRPIPVLSVHFGPRSF